MIRGANAGMHLRSESQVSRTFGGTVSTDVDGFHWIDEIIGAAHACGVIAHSESLIGQPISFQ